MTTNEIKQLSNQVLDTLEEAKQLLYKLETACWKDDNVAVAAPDQDFFTQFTSYEVTLNLMKDCCLSASESLGK